MEKSNSKRSTGRPIKGRSGKNPQNGKSRKRTKIEDDPIEPVNDVMAIPAALIEIREMVINLQVKLLEIVRMPPDPAVAEARGMGVEIEKLVNSCIQTIKTDGLRALPLTTNDYRLMADAVEHRIDRMKHDEALSGSDTEADRTGMAFLLRGLRNLADNGPKHGVIIDPGTPEEMEMVATVNPVQKSNSQLADETLEDWGIKK